VSTTPIAPARIPGLFDALAAWTDPEHAVLADLGYEGEAGRVTCPIKKPSTPKPPSCATRPASVVALSVSMERPARSASRVGHPP
jgi:hypothetical protein